MKECLKFYINGEWVDPVDPKHFDVGNGGFNNLKPEVYEDPNGVVSENGNTVDIQDGMVVRRQNDWTERGGFHPAMRN